MNNFSDLIQRFEVEEREATRREHSADAREVRVYVLPTGDREIVRQASKQLLAAALNIAVADISLEYGEHGKPMLINDRSLHFSTSHTDNLSLIGITRIAEIGVDVERVREVGKMEKIMQRFFHNDDAALVRESVDKAKTFAYAWTRGEAAVKVFGGKVWDMAKRDPRIVALNIEIADRHDIAAAVAVVVMDDRWKCVVRY